jgi:DNA-binding transcriptional MocR family regulator
MPDAARQSEDDQQAADETEGKPLGLEERIRTGIEDDILLGRLAPGDRLDERALAQRYHVSRTPVREALRHLASEGLIEIRPLQRQPEPVLGRTGAQAAPPAASLSVLPADDAGPHAALAQGSRRNPERSAGRRRRPGVRGHVAAPRDRCRSFSGFPGRAAALTEEEIGATRS